MPIAIALVALALPFTLSACGSGGSSSSGSSPPARGFSKSAELASYGEEADEAEREQASLLLEKNQASRGARSFSAQCETLASSVVEEIESDQGKSCAAVLAVEARTASPRLMAHTLFLPVEALRVEGKIGYALYHGEDGTEFAAKMEKENGEWKVVGLFNEEIH